MLRGFGKVVLTKYSLECKVLTNPMFHCPMQVQYKLELLGETLFLAVNIIDRSMHRKVCLKFSLEWNLQVSHLFNEAYLEKNYKYYRKESKIMTVHWNMDFERIYMGFALCNYILLSLLMLLLR